MWPFKSNSRKSNQQERGGHNHYRRLHIDPLEDRRMLATLTVNTLSDAAVDANNSPVDDHQLTPREAIAFVNRDFVPGPADRNARIDETQDLLALTTRSSSRTPSSAILPLILCSKTRSISVTVIWSFLTRWKSTATLTATKVERMLGKHTSNSVDLLVQQSTPG